MRTVDPEQWSRQLKKPSIQVTRNNRFGQNPGLRYERIIRESLVDAAEEFWTNCSVPIVKLINVEDISKLQRYCYILLLFLSLGSAIAIVSYICYDFYTTPPLAIDSLDMQVSITKVSFPAVALCSNNLISKNAFNNFTEFLLNHPKNQKRYNRAIIEGSLLQLGALLTAAASKSPNLDFDKFLSDVDLNITDVMFRLSPPCTSILDHCSWRGRQVPCDSLFATRITPHGFCCVFNSRYHTADAKNQPHILDLTGSHFGLGVVITENSNDFKYLRRNRHGAEMLLFEGSEYPLIVSGDVRTYPLPTNYSLYFNVKIMTQRASNDVKFFNENWRGCRTQGREQLWCLAECRRDTVAALCDCVPYTLHAAVGNDKRRVCSLRDITCLYKHREKFLYFLPSPEYKDDPQISEEMQKGIDCRKCRVMCNRRAYWAEISYAPYEEGAILYQDFHTKRLLPTNSTAIRMFYVSDHYKHLTLEPYVRWYETIAILSTQWMVLVGASIVTVVEVFYFFTFRWLHHFLRRKRLEDLISPSM